MRNSACAATVAALLALHDLAAARNMDHIYDDGAVSSSAFYSVIFSGLAGAAIGVAWAAIKNSSGDNKLAHDGAAIIGGLLGMLIGPLLIAIF